MKVHISSQPWIVIEYSGPDYAAEILSGKFYVFFQCAVCGDITSYIFRKDRVWFDAYRINHLHEVLQKENPLISWARPFLNPAALKAWGSPEDLKRKIEKE